MSLHGGVRRRSRARTMSVVTGVLVAVGMLAFGAASAFAHYGAANVSCSAVGYSFTDFAVAPGNTVTETVSIDGTQAPNQTFVFDGPSGTNTVAIDVPAGTHTVVAGAYWDTNGESSSFSTTITLTCGGPPPRPAKLCGVVYYDANGDGVDDGGDTPIGDVTVTATQTSGGTMSETTATNSVGAYCFLDLPPGTYQVADTNPAGFVAEVSNPGTAGGTSTDADTLSAIALTAGADSESNNFGKVLAQTIAGHIYGCSGGVASTTEVSGGTLGASGPQLIPVQANPLTATSVAAGSYTMTATAPLGYQLVACNGVSASPTQSVVVPSGGAGVGVFYVAPIVAPPPACPASPPKVNVRWHYSALGTSGSWSATATAPCGQTTTWQQQAMEGNLQVAPGTTIKAGFDFTMPGNNSPWNLTFTNTQVVFAVDCVSGATPSQPTFTVTMPDQSFAASDSNWYPSGNQSSTLVYQGSIVAPNLCGGGALRLDKGGTFSTTLAIS